MATASYLVPDITAPLTFQDVIAARDPALAAILDK